jgi:hypothetical protein
MYLPRARDAGPRGFRGHGEQTDTSWAVADLGHVPDGGDSRLEAALRRAALRRDPQERGGAAGAEHPAAAAQPSVLSQLPPCRASRVVVPARHSLTQPRERPLPRLEPYSIRRPSHGRPINIFKK